MAVPAGPPPGRHCAIAVAVPVQPLAFALRRRTMKVLDE